MPKKPEETPTNSPAPVAQSIYIAFLALQSDLNDVEFIKNAKGSTGGREYKYQDLPALNAIIKPIVLKHQFIWQTRPSVLNGEPSLKYALIYAPTGEALEGEMLLQSKSTNPQDQGSAITYARRYSLTAVLDIVADEDDDATKAVRAEKQAQETAEKPAHTNKKSNIFVMLREVKIDPDEYIKTLKGSGIEWEKITNKEADEILQKLSSYINYQRAQTAAVKTNIPAEIAPQ